MFKSKKARVKKNSRQPLNRVLFASLTPARLFPLLVDGCLVQVKVCFAVIASCYGFPIATLPGTFHVHSSHENRRPPQTSAVIMGQKFP